jgi:hypothetical protein
VLGDGLGGVVRQHRQADAALAQQFEVDVAVAGRVQGDPPQAGQPVQQPGVDHRQAGVGRRQEIRIGEQADGHSPSRCGRQGVIADVGDVLEGPAVLGVQALAPLAAQHHDPSATHHLLLATALSIGNDEWRVNTPWSAIEAGGRSN